MVNRPGQFWSGIAVGAFCLGIGMGRFMMPSNPATVPKSAATNPAAETSDASPIAAESSPKKARHPELAPAETGDDVYSQIKGVLESNGTSRLYDSFEKIAGQIDQNNVRDVLAFA